MLSRKIRLLAILLPLGFTACLGSGMPECWQPFNTIPVYRISVKGADSPQKLCDYADTSPYDSQEEPCEVVIEYHPDDIGLADITVSREGYAAQTQYAVPNKVHLNDGDTCFDNYDLITDVSFLLEPL